MNKKTFGKIKSGEEATLYRISNGKVTADISDYGATLVNVLVQVDDNQQLDVVLGYEDAAAYENNEGCFGATVGRHANRIGDSTFFIEGIRYLLTPNENGNNLHSGPDYFYKRMWSVDEYSDNKIVLKLHSPDGDQGFPGSLDVFVTYEITDDNMLKLIYEGTPDHATVLNMTNHSYFNLNGHNSGSILQHKVQFDAPHWSRVDDELIPTGESVSVANTAMDFTQARAVKDGMAADTGEYNCKDGYDHNFELESEGEFPKIGQVVGDISGLTMEIYTDLPAIQLYTGNYDEPLAGKEGAVYPKHSGMCLETQYVPNAINLSQYEAPLTEADEKYHTVTGYRFIV